jgi:hypothetical protein
MSSSVHCAADEFSAVAPGSFDLILLNSVVQYFPSFEYLVEVLRAASTRLAPGGIIYLGDLRHQGILPVFHMDVLLKCASDQTPMFALREELARRVEEEQELAISPAALHELRHQIPGLSAPCVALKDGSRHNELSRFRYDAMIRWQAATSETAQPATLDWTRDLACSVDELRRVLESRALPALRVKNIPNARLLRAARALRAADGDDFANAGALRAHLATDLPEGIEPEALRSLGTRLGRRGTAHVERDE